MECAIDIQHVSHRFSMTTPLVLSNIHATVPKGKMIGLVGPDGAGKTTLMRMMSALLLPSDGKISILGLDTKENPEQIHSLSGYMPQRFGLYEELSVLENLHLYADLRGISPDEKQTLFESLLHFTNLKPFTQRRAGALSGGMKQKLGLACALLKKPKILFLDEPSVGVDPISRKDLWLMVKSLLTEEITIVWSTAYLDEASQCDLVLLLNGGSLQFLGPPHELTQSVAGKVFQIKNPPNKRSYLQKIFQEENILDASIEGDDIRMILRDPSHLPVETCIPIEPYFEDAFIQKLGGMHIKKSLFSHLFPPIHTQTPYAIEAQHLSKKFGNFTAVDDVSFQIRQGEIFGFLGPNGAGKSTTFKMLCGLISPTQGTASLNGIYLEKDLKLARSQIGYMAQKFSLYGTLTVHQNLLFFLNLYSDEKNSTLLQPLIEAFNLTPYLNTPADLLPLGLKQRLSLTVATLHKPKILFLDEPTSGMDPVSRREFWMHANALAEQGCTLLVSTHFMEEAENCDRIALIYRGKIIELARPDDLKQKTRSKTLEDAFIHLIEEYDAKHPAS